MKRPRAHKVIPALFTTLGALVPVITVADLLIHVRPAKLRTTFTTVQNTASSPTATTQAAQASTPAVQEPKATPASTPRTYVGPIVYDRFGPVQATITVKGGKITNVTITTPTDPHSAAINSQAVPILRSETLQAQSANIDIVSGATDTSEAYIQSLQSVLKAAGL